MNLDHGKLTRSLSSSVIKWMRIIAENQSLLDGGDDYEARMEDGGADNQHAMTMMCIMVAITFFMKIKFVIFCNLLCR